jgi:hypothetical protein
MPGGDRTGPVGLGPMTGRGAGFCAGYSMPGYANPVGGRGFFGRGRGFGMRGGGRGRRNWFYAAGLPGWARAGYGMPFATGLTTREELEVLKEQAKYFEETLEETKKRIEELKNQKSNKD